MQRRVAMAVVCLLLAHLPMACRPRSPEDPIARKARLAARARRLELPTSAPPPPGDPLSHHAAGYAKTMCSAVFITGLDLDFAMEHVGYFTAPYAKRKQLGKPVVDRARKRVSVSVPKGPARIAVYTGGQGCVTLAADAGELAFKPVAIASSLPAPETQDWPLGDRLPATPLPEGLDAAKLEQAVATAFGAADAHTAALVMTWKGRLIAERYAPGITHTTPLESWSMGKSLIATLMGMLIHDGIYHLDQPAPVPQWQRPGDPRAQIRISDLLRMSSGLRMVAPQDPEWDPGGKSVWPLTGEPAGAPYPDHVYVYTGSVDVFAYVATRPQQWPPNTVGRYRNTDPLLVAYLTRLAVEKRGDDYLTYPQRALFDKLGVRTMVLETDRYGNFLTSGYDLASARDWARLGNLYLNDGVTPSGERLLPEGFVTFVRTVAPAWLADDNPVYGGSVWLNTGPVLPKDLYVMNGAGGQRVWIFPSHDLVVVRLGHFKGEKAGLEALRQGVKQLLETLPKRPLSK